MHLEWWHWIVGGIALILAELAIPSFFVVWFGLGALLVGLLLVLAPDLSSTAQLAVWTLASLAMVALWFKVFKPSLHKTRIGMAEGEAVGEIGLLVGDRTLRARPGTLPAPGARLRGMGLPGR